MQWIREWTWPPKGRETLPVCLSLCFQHPRGREFAGCPVVYVVFSSFDMIHGWSSRDEISNNCSDEVPGSLPFGASVRLLSIVHGTPRTWGAWWSHTPGGGRNWWSGWRQPRRTPTVRPRNDTVTTTGNLLHRRRGGHRHSEERQRTGRWRRPGCSARGQLTQRTEDHLGGVAYWGGFRCVL